MSHRLPPTQLIAVAGAPADDEPVTAQDRRRFREGQAWFAQHGGMGAPMEEVLAGFGLDEATLEDDAVRIFGVRHRSKAHR